MSIIFVAAIVFLCSIGLSFSNLENCHDKSAQLYRFYMLTKAKSNSTQNISQSFGSEIMKLVTKLLYKHKQSLEKSIELYRTGLNNTNSSDQSYMIFNRNAKSGSETLQSIISRQSQTNNFTLATDWNSATIMSEEQRKYVFIYGEAFQFATLLKVSVTGRFRHNFTSLSTYQ